MFFFFFQVELLVPLLDPRDPLRVVMMRYSCFNLNLGEGVSVGLVHIGCAVAFLHF